jgi:hypothetical protein
MTRIANGVQTQSANAPSAGSLPLRPSPPPTLAFRSCFGTLHGDLNTAAGMCVLASRRIERAIGLVLFSIDPILCSIGLILFSIDPILFSIGLILFSIDSILCSINLILPSIKLISM